MSEQYVGEIRLFAFPRVPTGSGWVACNGQSLSIQSYNALYALIGTTYGGDGVSTFNVPDLRGRVPIDQGTGTGLPTFVLGQPGGEENHTILDSEMPSHSHSLVSTTNAATTATPGTGVHLATASIGNLYAPPVGAAPYAIMAQQAIVPTGGSVPHPNIMPTLVGNFCIAVVGIYPSS